MLGALLSSIPYSHHPSDVPCPLPGGSGGCACRLLPRSCSLPQMAGGLASALSLSRPAQASLTLRPIGSLSRPKATFVTRLRPLRLPGRAARQLPATTLSAICLAVRTTRLIRHRQGETKMEVADLVLPVFAIIVTGWLAGWLGYISRSLADGLVHFAYNVAMPALLFVTIAREPARSLLEWRFLFAFGGGSILCFMLVFLAVRAGLGRAVASSTMYGMAAAMTNTGFVALPILH